MSKSVRVGVNSHGKALSFLLTPWEKLNEYPTKPLATARPPRAAHICEWLYPRPHVKNSSPSDAPQQSHSCFSNVCVTARMAPLGRKIRSSQDRTFQSEVNVVCPPEPLAKNSLRPRLVRAVPTVASGSAPKRIIICHILGRWSER